MVAKCHLCGKDAVYFYKLGCEKVYYCAECVVPVRELGMIPEEVKWVSTKG